MWCWCWPHAPLVHHTQSPWPPPPGDTVILKQDIFQLGGSQAVHTMVDCNNYPELGFLKPEHLCKLRCSEHLSIVNTVGCCWPRSLANISITNCWINKPQWRRCRTQDTAPPGGGAWPAPSHCTVTFNIILLNTTSLLHPFPLLFWAVLSFYYLWRFITLQHINFSWTPPPLPFSIFSHWWLNILCLF